MSRGRRVTVLRWFVLAAAGAGCGSGSSADPVFVEVRVLAADEPGECPGASRCVEVQAPVEGSRDGKGPCAIYGPGDPDDLAPLTSRDVLAMRPGTTTVWNAVVPEGYAVADLNPVCRPMVEG